ncbi:hypothetical protein M758_UG108200, partial [Ceratodon purpureus]
VLINGNNILSQHNQYKRKQKRCPKPAPILQKTSTTNRRATDYLDKPKIKNDHYLQLIGSIMNHYHSTIH